MRNLTDLEVLALSRLITDDTVDRARENVSPGDYVVPLDLEGIMELTVGKRLAIGNGILTVEDEAQAWARAKLSEGDKGGGAARAALTMVALKQQLLGHKR